eukprot:TRINITY_DN1382_c1_g1_i3.p2 TRINITY_DN1382_c1_g1~~TRINITY_DN1382_c1_g1_i3.p2  ORF type:complete len:100 (-),score=5.43 TRINITY_DN1382_c1_g1_i3:33-332(-)
MYFSKMDRGKYVRLRVSCVAWSCECRMWCVRMETCGGAVVAVVERVQRALGDLLERESLCHDGVGFLQDEHAIADVRRRHTVGHNDTVTLDERTVCGAF